MALTSRLHMAVSGSFTSALDLTTPTSTVDWARDIALATGTAAGQADMIFTDERTLAASATEDLDLAGVLTGPFGATLTFARIKGLAISASASNTNNVVIGAAASNAWATLLNSTGTVTLRPGGNFMVSAGVADATGWAVTAGTGDLLKIANSAGSTSVVYQLVIIGASA